MRWRLQEIKESFHWQANQSTTFRMKLIPDARWIWKCLIEFFWWVFPQKRRERNSWWGIQSPKWYPGWETSKTRNWFARPDRRCWKKRREFPRISPRKLLKKMKKTLPLDFVNVLIKFYVIYFTVKSSAVCRCNGRTNERTYCLKAEWLAC